MKYIIDSDISEKNVEELKGVFSAECLSHKNDILSYLKNAPIVAATSTLVTDYTTQKQLYKANNAHSDGVYQWYEDEIYHFEKYNLKLNDEFVQYVLEILKSTQK